MMVRFYLNHTKTTGSQVVIKNGAKMVRFVRKNLVFTRKLSKGALYFGYGQPGNKALALWLIHQAFYFQNAFFAAIFFEKCAGIEIVGGYLALATVFVENIDYRPLNF